MRILIAALALVAFSAHADLVAGKGGPVTITLLDSACSSELAAMVLKANDAKGDPKRADVMIAGHFVAACWSSDDDGDVLLVDRKGVMQNIYRDSFKDEPGI